MARINLNSDNRPYFTLVVRIDGIWSPQFGDFDRNVVKSEQEDWFDHDTKRADTKIIRTDGEQDSIDDAVRKLNQAAGNVSLPVSAPVPGSHTHERMFKEINLGNVKAIPKSYADKFIAYGFKQWVADRVAHIKDLDEKEKAIKALLAEMRKA